MVFWWLENEYLQLVEGFGVGGLQGGEQAVGGEEFWWVENECTAG
jgi:hypothetical protein